MVCTEWLENLLITVSSCLVLVDWFIRCVFVNGIWNVLCVGMFCVIWDRQLIVSFAILVGMLLNVHNGIGLVR